MIKNKSAFSLAEILITMGIVGFICVLAITLIRPSDKTLIYQYYNAYNTLRTATYNIQQDVIDANYSHDDSYNDIEKRFANTAEELCQKLASNPQNHSEVNSAEQEYKTRLGYINTSKYNCTGYKGYTNSKGFDESWLDNKLYTLAFQTSNSMLYYISEPSVLKIQDNLNNLVINKIGFVVLVDTNGTRKPNTINTKNGRLADIVPFIVLTSGHVIPIGTPTIDKKYMKAKVKIFTQNGEKWLSENYSYRDAQIVAFDDKQYPIDDLSSVYKINDILINSKNTTTVKQNDECVVKEDELPPCTVEIEKYEKSIL